MIKWLVYTLVPAQHCRILDGKDIKHIFVGYSAKSKGYGLYHHPQSKHILISHDVIFVEDAIQPLFACVKESDVTSQNVYETLLPLFIGGNVRNNEAQI